MIMFKFRLNKIRRIHVTMSVENNLFANNHIPVQIMRDPKHNLPSFFLISILLRERKHIEMNLPLVFLCI